MVSMCWTSSIDPECGLQNIKRMIPALYKENQRKLLQGKVSKMTDLEVVEVNVNVVDIKTKNWHEADSVSLQDRVTDVAESTGEFASRAIRKSKKSGISGGFSAVQEKSWRWCRGCEGPTASNEKAHSINSLPEIRNSYILSFSLKLKPITEYQLCHCRRKNSTKLKVL